MKDLKIKNSLKDYAKYKKETLNLFINFSFPILLLKFLFKSFLIFVVFLSAVLLTVLTSFMLYILSYMYIYSC